MCKYLKLLVANPQLNSKKVDGFLNCGVKQEPQGGLDWGVLGLGKVIGVLGCEFLFTY